MKATILLKHLVELEPFGHRFFGGGTVACPNALGLCPPGCDQSGLLRMGGKPGGDCLHAIARQFAVDVCVQFILGHG